MTSRRLDFAPSDMQHLQLPHYILGHAVASPASPLRANRMLENLDVLGARLKDWLFIEMFLRFRVT